jgi:DEAD/DEAH box helicase domain-containing protein
LFDLRDEIIARTIALIEDCSCQSGCPSCIGPILASDEGLGYAPKEASLIVLRLLSQKAPKVLEGDSV